MKDRIRRGMVELVELDDSADMRYTLNIGTTYTIGFDAVRTFDSGSAQLLVDGTVIGYVDANKAPDDILSMLRSIEKITR